MSIMQYRRRIKGQTISRTAGVIAGTIVAGSASAHASEQGLVLLLPTGIYATAGVACVVLTVLLMMRLPQTVLERVFRPWLLWPVPRRRSRWALVTSGLSALGLMLLVWAGLTGSRDPLTNPLPLTIWTVFWVACVSVQGLLGDLWRWINPWTGPVALTRRMLRLRPFLPLPARLGHGAALLTFLGFAGLLLADPAPSDPARLAAYCLGYWLFTYLALLAFGPRWAWRGEGFTMLMRNYALLSLFGRRRGRRAIGPVGWQALRHRVPPVGVAVFMLTMLGSGSFDGLNETFWWLDILGLNPLEFPGRSAIIWQTLAGLVVANAGLILIYALSLWLGVRLTGCDLALDRAFCLFAPSILPIALGYHIAHYLTSFLVDGQYVLAALNDPLARGDDLLGRGASYVTTGFFNTPDSVRLIWLTQAAAVVIGHVLAVAMAHVLALRQFGTRRLATLSQTPLAVFMVLYTLFGLWLLASPRGL
ncbi:hypothetical protein ACFMPD_06960 [Sedimentitalea sp. HM32M-2]|uniref:hypothetical protein n=1 Tax=Sedimentitalea sp. HM32M-2 TaxID=3351566 RepID=UPI00364436B8